MKRRSSLMELKADEQGDYFVRLRFAYGPEIVGDDAGLQTAYQRRYEILRHRFNAHFRPVPGTIDRTPRRLLLSITQHCTFTCSHCWVFGSPSATCSLDMDDLDAIHQHTVTDQVPRWTVSGGEFFSLPYFAQVLQRFPVDCIYSNGFWGYPKERCHRYVKEIATALHANPSVQEDKLTLILSYDMYHSEADSRSVPLAEALANIIAELYEVMPGIKIRISHAYRSPEDATYENVTNAVRQAGFTTFRTARLDHNGNIASLSYHYQKNGGPEKDIFIDTYPVALVGRSLLNSPVEPLNSSLVGESGKSSPRARYQYALGPDGGVGLYQVLYAPPVPYWVGDLVHESWGAIEQRLTVDPLALTVEVDGIAPILSFLELYYPILLKSLAHLPVIQQLLYLILLDPERRLFLNTWLSHRMLAHGRLLCGNPDLQKRIEHVIDLQEGACRQQQLGSLYGYSQDG